MQVEETSIRAGTAVEATDGRLGTVDEVIVRPESGELAYLVVRRGWSDQRLNVPAQLIERMDDSGAILLRVAREEAERTAGEIPVDALVAQAEGHDIRIPMLEERLVPGKRPIDLGELRILKHVDHVEDSVSQSVTRDDVTVERVPINRPLDAPVSSRTEGEVLVIPVMEEVLIVQKRLMLKEELRITRRQVVEDQVVRETVRHERLVVEDATTYGAHIQDSESTTPRAGAPGAGAPGTAGTPATLRDGMGTAGTTRPATERSTPGLGTGNRGPAGAS